MIESLLIIATLGNAQPASSIRVPVVTAGYHTVQAFDNAIDVTNRVLNRSIRADILRVHTDMINGEIAAARAKRNQQAVENHCKVRFQADARSNAAAECGAGFSGN